jgi:hypothetical protein
MSDESVLREKARELLRTGMLPSSRLRRMVRGPGGGHHLCAVCAQKIERDDVEIEMEVDRAGRGTDVPPDVYHLHPRCLAAWAFERGKIPWTRT